VGSVPFHLQFDPDMLAFMPPAVEGTFLGADGTTTVFLAQESSTPGDLVVGISRFGAPVGAEGSGPLATLEFRALEEGSAQLRFNAASVRDPDAKILPAVFANARLEIAAAAP
jgi:hypothetical protein